MVPYPYASDEIDLVEVGVSLWRRWKLMAIVFVICLGVGVTMAIIKPQYYNYTAVIRMGSYTKQDGSNVSVVSTNSAVAALNQGFINIAVQKYASAHRVDPRKIKIRASSPQGVQGSANDTVTLSGKAPLHLGNAYEAIEASASNLLSQSTQAQINIVRARFSQKMTEAKLKLARIQDPQQVKIEKSALKENVSSAKSDLEGLKEQYAVLKNKSERLQDAGKLYKRQEQQFSRYLDLDKARTANLAASKTTSPTQAMTALLLNNQVQQNLDRLDAIEQKLTVTLPQEIANTQADMANNKQQQTVKQNTLDYAEAKLANYDAQHQRTIDSQKAVIASLKAQIDNIQSTQLIVQPSRSVEPVGLRRSVIAILAAVIGLILALIAAMVANYMSAIRTRLQGMAPDSRR